MKTYNVNHLFHLEQFSEVCRLATQSEASIVALQETNCPTPSFSPGVAVFINGLIPYQEVVLPSSPDWEMVASKIFLPQPHAPLRFVSAYIHPTYNREPTWEFMTPLLLVISTRLNTLAHILSFKVSECWNRTGSIFTFLHLQMKLSC